MKTAALIDEFISEKTTPPRLEELSGALSAEGLSVIQLREMRACLATPQRKEAAGMFDATKAFDTLKTCLNDY